MNTCNNLHTPNIFVRKVLKMNNNFNSSYSPLLSDQQPLCNRRRLFWISHFAKKIKNESVTLWQPSLFWSCMNPRMLYNSPLPLSPTVKEPCQCRRGRGDCEFYVMINGVFRGLFSRSYLSPELNCSLFPALWMLECCHIIWDVPLTVEEAFDYLFMHLPFYFYLWEKGRKRDKVVSSLVSVLSPQNNGR